MSTVYSKEKTNELAGTKNHAVAFMGVPKTIACQYTVPAGGLTAGDVIELFTLPKDAVIIGGLMSFGAMGGGCTAAIGDAGDADKYLAATSVAAEGYLPIAHLISLKNGQKLTEDKAIYLTTAGGNYAAGKVINVVFYVCNS